MDSQISLDIMGVLPTWRVLNLPISLMMIMALVILRALVSLRNWWGALGAGDMGQYWGDELHSPWSMSGLLRSSKSISSPTVLRGELMLGVGIGIVKKAGDNVRRGIGIGDGDVGNKPLVSMCGDLSSEVGCISVDCTSGVKEGWLAFTISDDGGEVGDDVFMLLDSCVDNTIVVDLGIGVGCGGKDIGR